MSTPKSKLIAIRICEPCLAGEGKECHTPECALFLHSVDLPFTRELYQELPDNFDYDVAREVLKECVAQLEKVHGWLIEPDRSKAPSVYSHEVKEALERAKALEDA